MNCTRCLKYPCRCTGGVDVIAEHTARMLAQAQAHKVAIPPSDAHWPEVAATDESSIRWWCLKNMHMLGALSPIDIVLAWEEHRTRVGIPAQTPPARAAVSDLPKAEEPWSL